MRKSITNFNSATSFTVRMRWFHVITRVWAVTELDTNCPPVPLNYLYAWSILILTLFTSTLLPVKGATGLDETFRRKFLCLAALAHFSYKFDMLSVHTHIYVWLYTYSWMCVDVRVYVHIHKLIKSTNWRICTEHIHFPVNTRNGNSTFLFCMCRNTWCISYLQRNGNISTILIDKYKECRIVTNLC